MHVCDRHWAIKGLPGAEHQFQCHIFGAVFKKLTADMRCSQAFKRLRLTDDVYCARVVVHGYGEGVIQDKSLYVHPGVVTAVPARLNAMIGATPPPPVQEARPVNATRTGPFDPSMFQRGLKVRAKWNDVYYPAFMYMAPNNNSNVYTVYWDEDLARSGQVPLQDIEVDYGSAVPSAEIVSVPMARRHPYIFPVPSMSPNVRSEFWEIRGCADRLLGHYVDRVYWNARDTGAVARPLEWHIMEMHSVKNEVNQSKFQRRYDVLKAKHQGTIEKMGLPWLQSWK